MARVVTILAGELESVDCGRAAGVMFESRGVEGSSLGSMMLET